MSSAQQKSPDHQSLIEQYEQCNNHDRWLILLIGVYGGLINQKMLARFVELVNLNPQLSQTVALTLEFNGTINKRLRHTRLLSDNLHGLEVLDSLKQPLALKAKALGIYRALYELIQHIDASHSRHHHNYWQQDKLRQLRFFLNLEAYDRFAQNLELSGDPQILPIYYIPLLSELLFNPFDAEQFAQLSNELKFYGFSARFSQLRMQNLNNSEALEQLENLVQQGQSCDYLNCLLAEQWLLKGQDERAARHLSGDNHYRCAIEGWLNFNAGEIEQALKHFQNAIKKRSSEHKARLKYLPRLPGLFYMLCLLKLAFEQDASWYSEFDKSATAANQSDQYRSYDPVCFRELRSFAASLRAVDKQFDSIEFNQFNRNTQDWDFQLSLLVDQLCIIWNRQSPHIGKLDLLEQCFDFARQSGDIWYCQVAASILEHHDHSANAKHFLLEHPIAGVELTNLLRKKEPWQQALEQLIALKRATSDESTTATQRLIWQVNVAHWPYNIEAKLQKMGKKDWLKPTGLPLKRLLAERDTMDFLTLEDEKLIGLCKNLEKNLSYYQREISLSGVEALHAAAGHPLLFRRDDHKTPIKIELSPPMLQISQTKQKLKVTMPAIEYLKQVERSVAMFQKEEVDFYLMEQADHIFHLCRLDNMHKEIAQVVGEQGIEAPISAKQQVIEGIKAISPYLNIQSDMTGVEEIDMGMQKLEPDNTLYINIHNIGPGFEIRVQVQPLGQHGPTLFPGKGHSMVVEKINDVRSVVNRDLAQEKRQVEKLATLCPIFNELIEYRLTLDELESSLECLEQLHQLQVLGDDPKIVLQWQKGQPIVIKKTVGTAQMTTSAEKKQDWFSLKGHLKVSEDEVIELKSLLDMIAKNDSRFIPMGDNTYLAITRELRKQMQMLASVAYRQQFHPLATQVIEQAMQDIQFDTDQHFKTQSDKIAQAFALTPKLPSTLQANLRDYQQAGFDWAIRLAHFGGGACLADDMGLGKTLQALAVILYRAPKGPTLVLCPTSVCFNWQDETRRFTPTLNPVILGAQSQEQRESLLNDPQPFDLIICSYGILQTQSQLLEKVTWRTIVADEAQALKNPKAKRSLAAGRLNGEFKLITTGTPVENNLTELWSLFNFINPGLLGGYRDFNERFIANIENFDTKAYIRKAAANALRQRIGPFILRRLKTEVLSELPPRTDINLHVELSFEETALYEAMRRKAVETLLQKDKEKKQLPHEKRIKILAEIMKLRRACCHPSLVEGGNNIPGSKLKVFDELIEELLDNNHKVLVFSQFVAHLAILRQHLEKKAISYQYLDGSTSGKQRQQAVNAFQSGQGDVFLISLKAGGFGLNLTAADYVIHMDPWWNPAVEDQASDRAHRLGQTRPVTIYRLLCQNTIEDKILSLHQQKRELAESLLEGSDGGATLSVEEMMGLLAE